MAFGPKMRFTVGELQIELAPPTKEAMVQYVSPGFQQATVSRFLSMRFAPVLEDEHDWFEKTRANKASLVWGIWLINGDDRQLIGNSALNGITRRHIHQAESGSAIVRKDLWGKGIASAAHKARTWYAFQHMGLHRIKSGVLDGNEGSLKALTRSGYTVVYVERNEDFVDGSLRHLTALECLNPNDPFWGQWWHGDRPTKKHIEARQRTREVLKWAEENVTLL